MLRSDGHPGVADVAVGLTELDGLEGGWARLVAAVVSVLRPVTGFEGRVSSTVPAGAGLSSSAAFEVAVALALGWDGEPSALAPLLQHAEQVATGVPSGIMDQLASIAGVRGHALLIDCRSLEIEPVPLPDGAQVVVVNSGEQRALGDTAYAERRAQCEAAEAVVGPLRDASPADVESIGDRVLRKRARHVVRENLRVRDMATAFRSADLIGAGALMSASHASLRDDFEVSTPVLDELVMRLRATPGVFGARVTGAGFGGCVVALCTPGTEIADGWRVHAAAGASVEIVD